MSEQIIPEGHAKKKSNVEESKEQHAGCFDFMIKKKDDPLMVLEKEDAPKDGKVEEEKHTLMDELLRTHSHSTSSSEEEEGEEGGERKKKKKLKGLKEAIIKEKTNGEEEETESCVPMEIKRSEEEAGRPEEKKGFLEKIKEKLPGQHNKGGAEEETTQTTTAPAASEHSTAGNEGKEKKGIIDTLKEKLPGQRKNSNENVV